MDSKKHLLFVCTANVCRSPLAASFFKRSKTYTARSCGIKTLNYPETCAVSQDLIDWADEIVVMSENKDKHLTYLRSHFDISDKSIFDLDIPNDYDTSKLPERRKLSALLKIKLRPFLNTGRVKYSDYLKTEAFCPFCKSTGRTIASKKHAYLTYAIAPYHKHHLLVVPKRHILTVTQLNKQERADIDALQNLGIGLLNKLGYSSASLLVREGGNKDKSIAHVHCHIIPDVRIGDLDHRGRPRMVMSGKEIAATMNDFSKNL